MNTLAKIDYANAIGAGSCNCPDAFNAFERWQLGTQCCGIEAELSIFTGGFDRSMASFAGTALSNKAFYEVNSFGGSRYGASSGSLASFGCCNSY